MIDTYEEGEIEVEYLNVVRFNLLGYIDADAAAEFIEALWRKDSEDSSAVWEILINSEGGDMEAGTAIYSELASYSERNGGSHFVMTKVRGQAASCASLVLQSGDHRTAGMMDYIMCHEPMLSFEDATMQRVKDELGQAQAWTDNFVSLLAERSDMEPQFFADQLQYGRDWWVSAREALTLGMIDEIA